MMKAVLILLLFTTTCFGQESDIDFVIKKIKLDYPGFADKTTISDFNIFTTDVINKNYKDTFKIMATIIDHFHDRHLDLFKSADAIDTASCNRNYDTVTRYLNSSKPKKRYEGYWVSEINHAIIGIKQTSKNPLRYTGYLMEQRNNSKLVPGFPLCDFELKSGNIFFTKSTSTRSAVSYYVNSDFRSDSVITTGPYIKWKKIRNYSGQLLPKLEPRSDVASGGWLDATTFLITIPASTGANGEIVDSLVKANPDIKTKCTNLIVDLRNNTGGTVAAYDGLYPLIYTNPIAYLNSYLYCTIDEGLNKQRQLKEYIKDGGTDANYIRIIQERIKYHEDSTGKFIRMPADTLKLGEVLEFPKRVSLIVNFGCQSACEMFLLEAMQSKKVKLFGEHTQGAVDYINFYPQTTPSGKYDLYIPTNKRIIPPGGAKLDGIGIKPGVLISDTVADWVNYVKKYNENR